MGLGRKVEMLQHTIKSPVWAQTSPQMANCTKAERYVLMQLFSVPKTSEIN